MLTATTAGQRRRRQVGRRRQGLGIVQPHRLQDHAGVGAGNARQNPLPLHHFATARGVVDRGAVLEGAEFVIL